MKKLFITVIISVFMVFYSTSLLAADFEIIANCECSSTSKGAPCSCTNDQIDGWREKLTPLDSLLVDVTCSFSRSVPHAHDDNSSVKAAEVSGEDITCHKTEQKTDYRVFGCTNKSASATHYVHVTKVDCGPWVP